MAEALVSDEHVTQSARTSCVAVTMGTAAAPVTAAGRALHTPPMTAIAISARRSQIMASRACICKRLNLPRRVRRAREIEDHFVAVPAHDRLHAFERPPIGENRKALCAQGGRARRGVEQRREVV